jgi:hypothetical protein
VSFTKFVDFFNEILLQDMKNLADPAQIDFKRLRHCHTASRAEGSSTGPPLTAASPVFGRQFVVWVKESDSVASPYTPFITYGTIVSCHGCAS